VPVCCHGGVAAAQSSSHGYSRDILPACSHGGGAAAHSTETGTTHISLDIVYACTTDIPFLTEWSARRCVSGVSLFSPFFVLAIPCFCAVLASRVWGARCVLSPVLNTDHHYGSGVVDVLLSNSFLRTTSPWFSCFNLAHSCSFVLTWPHACWALAWRNTRTAIMWSSFGYFLCGHNHIGSF